MTLRHYLGALTVATAVAWIFTGVVIVLTDPNTAPSIVIVSFFSCLWLALVGTFAVVGFLARFWLLKKDFLLTEQVVIAFRQAIMLASGLTLALVLQSRGMMSLWVAGLMLTGLTLLESFFITAKRR